MATTKAPLFGLDASGSLGGAIVFSKWRGRTYVRTHVTPSNPKSGLQVSARAAMRFITQAWAGLSSAIKTEWDDTDSADNITGLNSQVKYNMPRNRQGLGLVRAVSDAAGTTPDAPATGTATAAPKSLLIEWTAGTAEPEYVWYIYSSETTGFTPGPSNLVRVVAAATLEWTHTGLTTGTAQYYRIRGGNHDGELGSLIAEFSGTPT